MLIFSERLVWYCGQPCVGTTCSTTVPDQSSVPTATVCGAELPGLLHEDVPFDTRNSMWMYLDVAYPNWWMGHAGSVTWPPRSPDLNLLDFYLWGRLKMLVYATEIPNVAVLQQRIENGCATVRNEVNRVCNIPRAVRRWAWHCVNLHECHFEHVVR